MFPARKYGLRTMECGGLKLLKQIKIRTSTVGSLISSESVIFLWNRPLHVQHCNFPRTWWKMDTAETRFLIESTELRKNIIRFFAIPNFSKGYFQVTNCGRLYFSFSTFIKIATSRFTFLAGLSWSLTCHCVQINYPFPISPPKQTE